MSSTVRIELPADEVFGYIADMENNPQWQRGQLLCTWTSDPPHGLGSTYDQRARFLGREIVSSFVVSEYVEGERIRIVSTAGTMPIDVTRTVRPASGAGCEVSAVVRGDPPAWMRLLGPLLKALVGRSVRDDYERLKQRLGV